MLRPPRPPRCSSCPVNLLSVAGGNPAAAETVGRATGVAALLVAFAFVAAVGRRWRISTATALRVHGPVLGAAAVAGLVVAATELDDLDVWHLGRWWWVVDRLATIAVPVAFLVGVVRGRLARAAVGDLVIAVGAVPPAGLRDLLARALGDPRLEVAYWAASVGGYVDLAGRPVELTASATRAVRLISDDGAPVAAFGHDTALLDEPELLDAVAATARLALANARLQAELRAQLDEVRASRLRIIEATDAERRRIERNLHDGAQQRLVSLAFALRRARSQTGDDRLGAQLDHASDELARALAELRELARGVHPTVLTDFGLAAALDALGELAAVPVRVHADVARLPVPVESAASYVAAEALANAAKHAAAAQVQVTAQVRDGTLTLVVADDGTGGARIGAGSGLRGMADRVRAFDGRLTVDSAPGAGTRITAEIPCG
jgi:signal transduction histidine kinase